MTDEHDRQARIVGNDALVQAPEIVDAFAPTVPLSKKSKLLGLRCSPAVAAMVTGVDCVSGAIQRVGKSSVSAGMLDDPVNNLNRCLWRRLGQPAMYEECLAIFRGEPEG